MPTFENIPTSLIDVKCRQNEDDELEVVYFPGTRRLGVTISRLGKNRTVIATEKDSIALYKELNTIYG